MRNFFIDLHNLMSKQKYISILIIVAILFAAGYYAYRLRIEEDVSAIIPKDERISEISDAISQSQFADQIILMFSLEDEEATSPELLISAADTFVSELENDTTYINSIQFRVESESFLSIYDFIHSHLPLFLTKKDYQIIEKKLCPENIKEEMAANYRTLVSPVGIFVKNAILKDPLHITPLAIERLENFHLDENFHIHKSCIFTKNNKHLLIFIDPHYPSSNTRENQALIELLETNIKINKAEFPEVKIQYYGGTAVAVSNADRIKSDIILTVTAALIVLSIFFFFVFRRLRYILLIFLPIIFGILISLAVLVIIEGTVSAMALGVGAVLIGISLDYSLHAFTHFRSSGSVLQTIKSISKPVVMSSFSTALAFSCLFIVQSKALNQLGLFAAVAIIATAIAVLTIVPFLLRGKKAGLSDNRKISFIDSVASYRFEKNKALIILIIILSIVFVFTSGKLKFNSDLSTLNYQTEALNKSEETLKSISSEAYSAVYFITQGSSLEEALKNTEKHEAKLRELAGKNVISEITTATDIIFSTEKQKKKIDKWNSFWTEEKKQELRKNLIEQGNRYNFSEKTFNEFYKLIDKKFEPLPVENFDLVKDNFLRNFISEANDIVSLITILMVDQEEKKHLFDAFEDKPDVLIFDNQYFIDRFLDVLKEDFRLLVLISMLLIFSILLVSYGRIELAIISFIPIILSWLWTVGLMGLIGIEFNIFNIIITTFIFGLGVDYSIFITSGLINRHKYGNISLTPYKMSVLLSAITTITSFGVLIFAKHPVLKSIAIVSILGITSVILITYTLLPLLFNFLISNKGKPRIMPVTLFNFTVSLNALVLFLTGSLIMTSLMPIIWVLPIKKKHKKNFVHSVICKFSWFITKANHGIKRKYINKEKLDFSKPSVIISNHQSYIDLVYLLLLSPKMIAFTNSWVYNSLFFGSIIRYADYYPVFKGLDVDFKKLEKKVKQGYSILVFPEGTRTKDGSIKRFHQGAFYIADKLNISIQPIMIHGIFECIPKSEFFLKSGTIHIKFFDKIKVKPANIEEGHTYKEQAKELTSFYRDEFEKLKKELETPKFFKKQLISQYLYKGPVLEWYLKTKIKAENNYSFYNNIVPENAKVADIGCGYGFLSLMLHYTSKNRKITGLDYDEEKIKIAKNIPHKTENLQFELVDITEEEIPDADVYIFNDVLHYIPKEIRNDILESCMDKLKQNSLIILRDADIDLRKRTFYTKYTEIQSTKIMKFNKKKYKLSYFSGQEIENLAREKGLVFNRIDQSRFTSNITYVIKKPNNEQV